MIDIGIDIRYQNVMWSIQKIMIYRQLLSLVKWHHFENSKFEKPTNHTVHNSYIIKPHSFAKSKILNLEPSPTSQYQALFTPTQSGH